MAHTQVPALRLRMMGALVLLPSRKRTLLVVLLQRLMPSPWGMGVSAAIRRERLYVTRSGITLPSEKTVTVCSGTWAVYPSGIQLSSRGTWTVPTWVST